MLLLLLSKLTCCLCNSLSLSLSQNIILIIIITTIRILQTHVEPERERAFWVKRMRRLAWICELHARMTICPLGYLIGLEHIHSLGRLTCPFPVILFHSPPVGPNHRHMISVVRLSRTIRRRVWLLYANTTSRSLAPLVSTPTTTTMTKLNDDDDSHDGICNQRRRRRRQLSLVLFAMSANCKQSKRPI